MAWVFTGHFLDNIAGDRVVAGTGEHQDLPGRFALAGLVDAHSHPTVAVDEQGPYLADADFAGARLAEYASSGVTVIRDVGGRSEVTLAFAATEMTGCPLVTAAGRFLAPANRYFPRMHSPVAAGELAAAIKTEIAAGARWVKVIGDFPEWRGDGLVPHSGAATYDYDVLREAVEAAHAAGARVAVHSNLPDSGLVEIGADSIEHGRGLNRSEIEELGARGGAWTPTLSASLKDRDSSDPVIRHRVDEQRERLREYLPHAVSRGVKVLAGTDVVGTIAEAADTRVTGQVDAGCGEHELAVTSWSAGLVERADREFDQQVRTLAAAAYQPECAADRLHPVPEAYQARAALRIGSADAVVADVEPQHATGRVDLDMNFGRVRMLGCIRQCL